ncbi:MULTISPECIES: hypothetical protein [unclassified Flavobacterium]|uniref:hypothetical protein n=1 Tax=unclassified Flavobacterium TaxID=196869 RepID=UPI001290BAED|nr:MULTISPECIES: hypothetical protein [unclassified Flavobacterium]MQP51239.1 hypothetical protein [Flavobacterium sp. LMO9]MQP61532.1 hypothetical protein [Flavobacterium sp. LMO6]
MEIINRIIKYLLILIFSFINFSCFNKEEPEFKNNHYEKKASKGYKNNCLSVYFIQKGTTFPVRMDCNFTQDNGKYGDAMHYKRISDSIFLNIFLNEYNKLEISKESSNIDVRFKIFIHHNNKKVDTLCLGENYGIIKNGIKMNDSKVFLNLIKTKINYESVFNDPMEEYKKAMEEELK